MPQGTPSKNRKEINDYFQTFLAVIPLSCEIKNVVPVNSTLFIVSFRLPYKPTKALSCEIKMWLSFTGSVINSSASLNQQAFFHAVHSTDKAQCMSEED